MDEKITLLIESDRAQDRKKAVALLRQMGDADALRTLAVIYKNDPNAEVKALALQAGKEIKNQAAPSATETQMTQAVNNRTQVARAVNQTQSAPAVNQTQVTRAVNQTQAARSVAPQHEDIMEDDDFKPVFVSETRQQQAADLLQNAEDALRDQELPRAIDQVVKAFRLNPNYRIDSHAMTLAFSITQMDKPQFLEILEDDLLVRDAIRAVREGKQKRSQKGKLKIGQPNANGDKDWLSVGLDLLLYTVIIAGLIIIFLVVATQTYQTAVATLGRGCGDCTPAEMARLSELVREFKPLFTFTPVQGVLYGSLIALAVVARLIVYYIMLHFMAQMMIANGGSFRGMLYSSARIEMIANGITLTFLGIGALMFLHEAFNPHYVTLYPNGGSAMWRMMFIVGGFTFFIGGLWSLVRLMNYYNGGCFQVGCTTYFASLATSWILSAVASGVVEQIFPPTIARFLR
ncbi:hypothetical protein HC776_00395 [bacterium]|nr:hypothetical protein [bacterium]